MLVREKSLVAQSAGRRSLAGLGRLLQDLVVTHLDLCPEEGPPPHFLDPREFKAKAQVDGGSVDRNCR